MHAVFLQLVVVNLWNSQRSQQLSRVTKVCFWSEKKKKRKNVKLLYIDVR